MTKHKWSGFKEIFSSRKERLLYMHIPLFVFSVLLTCCLFTPINWMASVFMPTQEITIAVQEEQANNPSNLYILDTGNCSLFAEYRENPERYPELGYIDKKEGYAYSMLVAAGDLGGYEITYREKVTPGGGLLFWANADGSQVCVTSGEETKQYNLYSATEGGEYIAFYPFQDTLLSFGIKVFLYLVFCGSVFLFLTLFLAVARKIPFARLAEKKRRPYLQIAIFFFISYTINVVLYVNRLIPNFLAHGDQIIYWEGLWNAGGKISDASQHIRVWNGYICYVFPYISRLVGTWLSVDPAYIWFVFPSFAVSVMLGYSIPTLYEWLSAKEAKSYYAVILFVVYVFFWVGTLSAVLTDLMGLSSFLLATALTVRGTEKEHWIHWAGAGVFYAFAISYRTAYLFAVVPICIALIVRIVILVQSRKLGGSLKTLCIGLLAFSVVCIPQIIINRDAGIAGPFPYEDRETWSKGKYDRSLTEYSINMSGTGAFTGHPYVVGSDLATSMRGEYPLSGHILTFSQGLDMFISRPMDTIGYIIQKLWIAFDVKTVHSYPESSLYKHSRLYLFSFLNYFVIGTAVYVFFKRKINVKEKLFFVLGFILLVLTHTITHIEWRYYLFGYVMLYFLFSYYACDYHWISGLTEREKGKYLMFINIYIAISFFVSLEFYAPIL